MNANMKLRSPIPTVCFTTLLALLAPAWCVQAADVTSPAVSSVFGQERSSGEDVIHFRNNDVLRGKVLNETLEIATAYGDVKVELRKCAGVSFEGARANTESIVTVNWNRLTGIIKDRTIRFQIGSSGAEIPVRKEKVRFVLLKKSPAEAAFVKPGEKSDLYVMSNGDLLTGQATSPSLKIQTDYGEIPVGFAEIKTVEMQGGNNVTAIIKKSNGDTMRGSLLTDEMTLNLDVGSKAEAVYKDKFSRIYVADGVRQVAELFGSLAPMQGESDGAAFASPSLEGRSFVNSLGMKFQLIPAGAFAMGSEDGGSGEKPVHEVEISKPLYMGVYEVTQAEYEAVTGQNPGNFKGTNNPVENVSWNEAVSFCAKLEEKEKAAGKLPAGHEYRLPTEAEWEYACRAGGKGKWCFGDDESQLTKYAWFTVNSESKTHPVGLKRANAWGLHDMHGNVWEWCKDWFGDYSPGKAKDPCNNASGSIRVFRGGSWSNAAGDCQSADRGAYDGPSNQSDYRGFRVVLAPSQP